MADKILEADRRKYPKKEGAHYFGILSEEQWGLRAQREVLTRRGNFDVEATPGCYYRAWNPLANTRPIQRRQFSLVQDPWHQHLWESYGEGLAHVWLPSARREDVVGGEHWSIWPLRDPAGATPPGQNYYHHLTRAQRCSIRTIMAAIPADKPRVREAVKRSVAEHYGIPTWVIARCCGKVMR